MLRPRPAVLDSEPEFINAVMDTISTLVVVLDRRGCIVRANRACEELTGYTAPELLGHHIAKHAVAKDDLATSLAAFDDLPGGQFPETHESWWVTRRGKRHLIAWSNTALLAADGAVAYVVGTGTDITDRRRLELDAQTRVRTQAAVAELGQMALAGAELSRLRAAAVSVVTTTLGVELCALLEWRPAGSLLQLVAGSGWQPGLVGSATVDAALGTQAGYALELGRPVIVAKLDCETRFALMPLLCSHGAVSGVDVLVPGVERPWGLLSAHSTQHRAFTRDDVTFLQGVANVLAQAMQRATADEAIRSSEQEFRALAEAIPQHVWTARSDGSSLYVNQRWVDYTGLPQHQGWGTGWSAAVHPDDLPRALEAWRANARVDALYSIELRFRRADGIYQWWLVRGVPVRDSAGQVVKWFGTSTDIDELKQAEAALRAKKRELAQSLARQQALSRRLVEVREVERKSLSSEMHDRIGQNLSALSINLDLIAQSPRVAAGDECSKRLTESRSLLVTTIASVRDLITELRPPVLDDYGLLAGLRALAHTVAARAGIRIEVIGDEAARRLALPAEAALFRIAEEALTNVCKHARAARVGLELRVGAQDASLSVGDDGCGFDPAGPKSREPRSHWGLLLMQERAEAIGASLRVDSAPGRGTRIVVELPTPA